MKRFRIPDAFSTYGSFEEGLEEEMRGEQRVLDGGSRGFGRRSTLDKDDERVCTCWIVVQSGLKFMLSTAMYQVNGSATVGLRQSCKLRRPTRMAWSRF